MPVGERRTAGEQRPGVRRLDHSMNFAINFSHPSAALLADGRIKLDRFKTPSWPAMIAEASALRPVAVHFDFQAGRGRFSAADWDAAAGLLEGTATPFVNLHLSPTVDDYPGVLPDSPTSRQSTQIIDQLLSDVTAAVERFGAQRVIAENVPYHGAGGKTLRTAIEPEVIGRILAETGCGLLLDISHARIAAQYLGLDEREYLSSLPVHRLRELHFTGLNWVDGLLQDHLPAAERDWSALAWVLQRIQKGEWARPWMLVFEYGGVGGWFETRTDPLVIAEQAPRLYEMVKSI